MKTNLIIAACAAIPQLGGYFGGWGWGVPGAVIGAALGLGAVYVGIYLNYKG